jgi:hypothetical protein
VCGFVFVVRASNRLICSSRYYGHKPEISEIEIVRTLVGRSHWGPANREVKRLMLEQARYQKGNRWREPKLFRPLREWNPVQSTMRARRSALQ